MRTLLKNASIINVFTDEIMKGDILIQDDRIIGTGDYANAEADIIRDLEGKTVCPGFMDGHIHIESTMLMPEAFAKVALPHGTTAVAMDPHEITNVCGTDGIDFMLQASENLPLTMYVMLPSCVPATGNDESFAVLHADDLRPYYQKARVLGLAEMMNFPGIVAGDPEALAKVEEARQLGKVINGHAPMLAGKDLDQYIAVGVADDHECYSAEEAMEKIRKGQHIMIREGTAARNLEGLMPLMEEPWNRYCMLVTDDKHPADLLSSGHIDTIIRKAVSLGGDPVKLIRMATIQAARHFGLRYVGAIAPGYRADLCVLDDLNSVKVRDVYHSGKLVCENGKVLPFESPVIDPVLLDKVRHSFHVKELTPASFHLEEKSAKCRVIQLVRGQLLTNEWITDIDWSKENGIDTERDILKLAVIERHHATGHIGLGFISGMGMKHGAIASSVSHDSHNLIVVGTSEEEMAFAANQLIAQGGGNIVVDGGKVIASMPLRIAGLMCELPAEEAAPLNEKLRESVHALGTGEGIEPFMNMAFVSLSVIPNLKMTTFGPIDVMNQKLLSVYVEA